MKVIACMMLLVAVACATMVDKDEIQQNMMEEHMEDTAESGVQMRACAADNNRCSSSVPCCKGCTVCKCNLFGQNCRCTGEESLR
uniref:U40-Austrotoxin-Ht1e_1 n=1 Tax=Hickmania troglodytes TaxID=489260 RepID=A0A482Z7C9_9ARAC